MKDFKQDFYDLYNKLHNNKNFAFSKYADGELKILKNEPIDLIFKANGEFKYDPLNKSDEFFKEKLMESFVYKDDDYYVGIGCKCCIGEESYKWMLNTCGQDNDHVTWANIWVNSNYPLFQQYMIPEFKNHDIVLVCNFKADTSNLPFYDKIVEEFRVGTNAWVADYEIVEEIKQYIIKNNIKNHLFLFAAGPFGNILTHQLYLTSKENTFIDIGSTLDPYMGLGKYRSYLSGGQSLQKTCI